MRGTWSGDVDLNDGSLEQQYADYRSRLQQIQDLKLNKQDIPERLESAILDITKDLEFLHTGIIMFTYIVASY